MLWGSDSRISHLKEIAPNDLRRTFAKLAHKGKAALEQIQLSLGHARFKRQNATLGCGKTWRMRRATGWD